MSTPLPTAAPQPVAAPGLPSLQDLVALTKPRLTVLVVATALGSFYLAPGHREGWRALAVLVGAVFIVGGAGAINQYLERDSDRLMRRTRNRPLPAGRLAPRTAVIFGVILGAIAVAALWLGGNALTAALGAFGYASYVFVYTPMKQRSPAALFIGAVPGAVPPLMGWTAATGRIDEAGCVLFAILFLWQVPHFLAIAFYGAEDFANAGIKALPLVTRWGGAATAKKLIVLFTLALLPTSLLLYRLGLAGAGYAVVATIVGVAFIAIALAGLRRGAALGWAKALFFGSLTYLTTIFIALSVDGGR